MVNKLGITICDVADLAKVSMATVSRVLNYPDKVNTVTKERVLNAIDELGYVPNPIARDLAFKKNYFSKYSSFGYHLYTCTTNNQWYFKYS